MKMHRTGTHRTRVGDTTPTNFPNLLHVAARPRTARPLQFGLSGLLLATTLTCVTAAAWRVIGWPALFVALTALMIAVACRRCGVGERRRRAKWAVIVGAAPLAHAVVAGYAYETLGDFPHLVTHVALVVYWPVVVLYLCGRHQLASDLAIVLALVLVAPQAMWAIRLPMLRDEVKRIVDFAENQRQQSGVYPKHLDDYDWGHRHLEPHIEYGLGARDEPIIYFRPSSFSEPHWYSSTSGWGYEPD